MQNNTLAAKILFLQVLLLFISAAPAAGQTNRELLETLDAYPDLIAYNGKIAVMDQALTTVQALAVRDRRVLVLGSNEKIRPLAGPATRLIDLKGRTVLPGLIDSHTHPHLWVQNHFGEDPAYTPDPQLQVTPVLGLEEDKLDQMTRSGALEKIGSVIRKRAAELGPDKWILVNIPMKEGAIAATQLSSVFQRRWVSTNDLDRISPENPVALVGSLANGVYNSQARRIISQDLRKDIDHFKPVALRVSYYLIYDIILKNRTEEVARMLQRELEEVASFGVTTVQTHIEPLEVLKALHWLDRRGEMPVRWAWIHRIAYSLAKDPAEFYRLLGDFTGQGSEHLWNSGVGEEGWDSNPCTKAVPQDPATREQFLNLKQCQDQSPGSPRYQAHLEALLGNLRLADVHATQDGTTDIIFQLMDDYMEQSGKTLEDVREKRHFFDHPLLIRPDQIPKLAEYGLWMNMQATGMVRRVADFTKVYGDQYLAWFTPTRSMLDAGARFTLATDAHYAPVPHEHRLGAWPWYGFWPLYAFYVTREWDGQVWNAAEKLDRINALRGWTTWAAESVLREKDLGSLEKGKLADFAVLDRDYFSIPESEIKEINNLMTVVGGTVIYRSGKF